MQKFPGCLDSFNLERETFVRGNVLIRCVGKVGRGRRARGGRRSRKKELGRGNTLSKRSLPQGMVKGKSVGAPGTQRWLSLQIGAGITHLDR